MSFDDLIGKALPFYGCEKEGVALPNESHYSDGLSEFQFRLGGVVWAAVCDYEDGYRSSMKEVRRSVGSGPMSDVVDLIFECTDDVPALAVVRVEKIEKKREGENVYCAAESGYRLVDVDDGYIWLEMGTDHSDNYYPSFCFDYFPKVR